MDYDGPGDHGGTDVVAVTLTWARTWPDRPDSRHDFVAMEDGATIGRIRRTHMAEGHAWFWTVTAIPAGQSVVGFALTGHEPTKQGATDRVKAAWARWVEMGRRVPPQP